MKNLFYFISAFVLLSCSGETENTTEQNSAEKEVVLKNDTTIQEVVPLYYSDTLKTMFGKAQHSDFTLEELDSLFIASLEKEEETFFLSGDEVSILQEKLVESPCTEFNTYQINEFLKMDSLNESGELEEYLSSLDIGMMARIDAGAIQLISLNDSSDIFLWFLDYNTFEACPYASGTAVYGSLFVNKEFRNTAVLGDISGGGDPPVWGRTLITSIIQGQEIKIVEIEEYGDEYYDEEKETYKEETTREESNYTLKIVDGYLVETYSKEGV